VQIADEEDEPLPSTFPEKTFPATQLASSEYDVGSDLDQNALEELARMEEVPTSVSTSFLKTVDLDKTIFNREGDHGSPTPPSKRAKPRKMKNGNLFFGK